MAWTFKLMTSVLSNTIDFNININIWPSIVLILILILTEIKILILILILTLSFWKYWYWYWYWQSDIAHQVGRGIKENYTIQNINHRFLTHDIPNHTFTYTYRLFQSFGYRLFLASRWPQPSFDHFKSLIALFGFNENKFSAQNSEQLAHSGHPIMAIFWWFWGHNLCKNDRRCFKLSGSNPWIKI